MIELLTFPGVVFHELGHQIFCIIAGVKVRKAVYFRFGNPAGYVIHDTPDSILKALLITFGPFISGTFFSLVFYNMSGIFFTWLGFSTALHCFPSSGDAKSLWSQTNSRIRRNIFALIGYPFALLIWTADILKAVYFDFFYAVGLYLLSQALLM